MNSTHTDILVIGGGIVGTLLAYFLAKAGREVLLVEEFDLGTLASGSNAGSLHAQIPHEPFVLEGEAWARGFAPAIPLMVESIGLWQELAKDFAVDLEISLGGGLLVAETDAQMRDVRRKAALEREAGLHIDLLDAGELQAIAPYLSERMIGGAFCPQEGKINPLLAMPAIAKATEEAGVTIWRQTRLTGLKTEAQGFIAATSRGEISARRVVNCAGARAGEIARLLGVGFEIQGYPIQVNVTEPVAPFIKHLVYSAGEKLTLKQARMGSLLIGGGWPALLDPKSGRPMVNPASARTNLQIAVAAVPQLAEIKLLRTWPAIVNGTADWRPILGEVPSVPGFHICMFPWMGLTAGPLSARLVADAVLGKKPPIAFQQFFLTQS